KQSEHSSDSMPSLELPASVTGKILRAEDEERFSFHAKEDDLIEIRIEAASLGSPLDAWLKIEDKSGKELARSDDADGSRDPRLEWKAPNEGDYVIVVGSVTHRGGEDFGYRLKTRRLGPDYKASIASSSFALVPGATNAVKFTVTRLRDFTNELRAEFRGLP